MGRATTAAGTLRASSTLTMGEQVARDARTRLVAAGFVVLVHTAYPPGAPALADAAPGTRAALAAAFTLVVAFPVHTFVLLAFLSLRPRVEAGLPASRLVALSARRLVPAHLFWVAVFLGVRALLERALPTPGGVVEGVVLGTAAAHLYFTPMLLVLTACAPLLVPLARSLPRALAAGLALAGLAIALHLALGRDTPWHAAPAGYLGMVPYALAGLALGRAWAGNAPAPVKAGTVALVAGVAALVAGALLVHAALAAEGAPLPLTPGVWVGRLVFALAIPVLVLTVSAPLPGWALRLAPLSLGVYFVHPLVIKAVQLAEARVPALDGLQVALVLPNALLALVLSLGLVAALARTPLRRFVT